MRRGSAMGLRSPFELLFLLFTLLVPLTSAVRFDLIPNTHSGKHERCIRNFVARDQLVVVTATVSGSKGDGQVVNMHVRGGLFSSFLRQADCNCELHDILECLLIVFVLDGIDQEFSRRRLRQTKRYRRRDQTDVYCQRRLLL